MEATKTIYVITLTAPDGALITITRSFSNFRRAFAYADIYESESGLRALKIYSINPLNKNLC